MNAARISAQDFGCAMQAFAPFEKQPHLAVAVSGGADSTVLVLLAHEWAIAHNGKVTALIVDHGLRVESSDEAARTRRRLQARGIDAVILLWKGRKARTGIQAAARAARYELLENWCRTHGVLHLLIGHHLDDQAETVMMRLSRGSGPDGLAAMPALRELNACRVLRPLLSFSRSKLHKTLSTFDVQWIEDPSNDDPKYGRTHARLALQTDPNQRRGLADSAQRFARQRTMIEDTVARWVARSVSIDQAGFAYFLRKDLSDVAPEIALRAIARLGQSIGGTHYGPSTDAVERLYDTLCTARGASLSRSIFDVRGDHIRVFREARNLPENVALDTADQCWDNRFAIRTNRKIGSVSMHAFDDKVRQEWPKSERPEWLCTVPFQATSSLPVFLDQAGWFMPRPSGKETRGVQLAFKPMTALSGVGFFVA